MYGEGKFFFIRSQLNGLVLDIKDGIANPGQDVVTWEYTGEENQLWFCDVIYNTIRSKMDNNLVLQAADGECLTVAEFDSDEYNQRWILSGEAIRHYDNPDLALDIDDKCEDEGAGLCSWEYHGESNQLWEFNYLPPKQFFIVSQMNGRVLDVKGNDPSPGTKAVMWDRNDPPSDNQLWYEDKYGTILSCLNDYGIDTSDDVARMQPYDACAPSMQWIMIDGWIFDKNVVEECQVLEIKASKDKNGAKVVANTWELNCDNQLWQCDYIDD